MTDASAPATLSFVLPRRDDAPWQIDLGGGRHMLRVNPYLYYQLGLGLKPLADLGDSVSLKEAYMPLVIGRAWIQTFQKSPVSLPLTLPVAQKLVATLAGLIPDQMSEEKQKESVFLWSVKTLLKEFETLLNNELESAAIYHVDQKGIYSTADLIDRADKALPDAVRSLLSPEALTDVNSAGRCLAFDLPTAAGFHIMRAVEDVLLDYSEHFEGSRPSRGNWGKYVKDLEKTAADQKVVAVIDQIRNLHRNPTLHPEDTLDDDEATTLFSIALSSIIAMKNDIVAQPNPTLLATPPIAQPAKRSGTGSNAP